MKKINSHKADMSMIRLTKSVKRFERSNGLDTALYKNYLFFTIYSNKICITRIVQSRHLERDIHYYSMCSQMQYFVTSFITVTIQAEMFSK